MGKAGRIFVLTALMVGALLAAPAAHAKLKATNVVYAWDRTALRYQNSNVVIYWDNGWVPFIHKIGFDNGNYTSPTVCPTSSTDYAGIMEFGLYNEDNNPAGADGFLRTRDWKLVYCDRTGDGDFTNDDLSVQPPTGFTEYSPLTSPLTVITSDEQRACSTGNCAFEIVTTMEVNLDEDCNGVIDTTAPICFFAEAQVPPSSTTPIWQQQLQARISSGGGDKTVNFSIRGPTAVTLMDLSAGASGLDMRYSLAALGLAGAALAGIGWLRRGRRGTGNH